MHNYLRGLFVVAMMAGLTLGCEDQTALIPDGVHTPTDAALDLTPGDSKKPDPPEAGTLDLSVDGIGDASDDATPVCVETLIPAPCQQGYDAKLEGLATAYERSFHALSAAAWDVWADISVDDPADRTLVETFLQQGSSWDFKAATGKEVTSVVSSWHKAAGLYAGVGIAADAFRYGVLRDQGYPKAEVDRARKHLLAALDALHVAKAITGTPGAIARGFIRTDKPTYIYTTTPLFDGNGKPLPAQKNNGTWREDNSGGQFPQYIWEDSCSRDQLIGWIAAYGAAWEVVQNDPTIPQLTKQRLQQETKELGMGLKTVRKSGYDLELIDADGRTTYHGYLNENNFDRIYVPFLPVKNGLHAIMALGIISTLVYVSGDPVLKDYLDKELIGKRKLQVIARDQLLIDFGAKTNYSNYNMAFTGAWLAVRYLDHPQALADARLALEKKLYANPAGATKPQAEGWKQSLFDLTYAAGKAEATAHGPTTGTVDAQALNNALETLNLFPQPPYWNADLINCDAKELQAMLCTAIDGKTTFVINPVNDRGDHPQSMSPVPYNLRPPSNYDWRSNPFRINGSGSPSLMLTGVDFRFAYWLGRWVRRQQP